MPMKQILLLLEEIYDFSIQKNPPQVDSDFVEWFVKRTVNLEHDQTSFNFPSNCTIYSPIRKTWPLVRCHPTRESGASCKGSDSHWLVYPIAPSRIRESAMQYKTFELSFWSERSAAPRHIISSVAFAVRPNTFAILRQNAIEERELP